MADNREPNSFEAPMAKSEAGRVVTDITLSCVELTGSIRYSEVELLEKWPATPRSSTSSKEPSRSSS